MLASRIQPTYLTDVCQVGFKKCILTNDMDYCAHLLHDCTGTRNFTQPVAIQIEERPVEPPLTFTDTENEVNQRRCMKQQFYAMFFNATFIFFLFFIFLKTPKRPIRLPPSLFPNPYPGINKEQSLFELR